nr:MAG TPA: hypothetical protein [Caudoviricetes sp.]
MPRNWKTTTTLSMWLNNAIKQGQQQPPQRTPDYWEGWCDALKRAKHIHETNTPNP